LSVFCARPSYVPEVILRPVVMAVGGVVPTRSGT
jgi:hypothetical protein